MDFYILSQGVPPQLDSEVFQRVRMGIINAWKRTLIRDIEFCIACEARHMGDTIATPKKQPGWLSFFKTHFGEVGEAWFSQWQAHQGGKPKAKDVPNHWDEDELADVAYVLTQNAANDGNRLRSYFSAKTAESNLGLSLIEVCTKVFDPALVAWHGGYGGKAWQRIAAALFDLWYATDATEIVRLIDTCFALHHNTNIVFNKNQIWAQPHAGHSWIQRWLDYKWAAHSAVSLLGLASDAVQSLAAATGFHMARDLAPADLAKRTDIAPGWVLTLKDGLEVYAANVVHVGGDYFRSVILSGEHYQVHKTFGKHEKVLHERVYLLNELLPLVTDMKAYTVGVDKAAKAPKAASASLPDHGCFDLPHYAEFQALKPQLTALYDYVETLAAERGATVGSFLEDKVTVRFRVKGLKSPLRFYFMMTDLGLRMSVGSTEEADLVESKPVLVSKNPTDKQLREAVQAAFKKADALGEQT